MKKDQIENVKILINEIKNSINDINSKNELYWDRDR